LKLYFLFPHFFRNKLHPVVVQRAEKAVCVNHIIGRDRLHFRKTKQIILREVRVRFKALTHVRIQHTCFHTNHSNPILGATVTAIHIHDKHPIVLTEKLDIIRDKRVRAEVTPHPGKKGLD